MTVLTIVNLVKHKYTVFIAYFMYKVIFFKEYGGISDQNSPFQRVESRKTINFSPETIIEHVITTVNVRYT